MAILRGRRVGYDDTRAAARGLSSSLLRGMEATSSRVRRRWRDTHRLDGSRNAVSRAHFSTV
jgi:hypothetical protein